MKWQQKTPFLGGEVGKKIQIGGSDNLIHKISLEEEIVEITGLKFNRHPPRNHPHHRILQNHPHLLVMRRILP
jgi:hypothetical protein